MSGGHFDYKQHYINDIADDIESVVHKEESPRPELVKEIYTSIYEKDGDRLRVNFNTLQSENSYDETIKHYKDAGYSINEICSKPGYRKSEAVKNGMVYQINEWVSEEYKDEDGETVYFNDFSKETLEEFKTAIELLRKAAVYAQRIDWLLSGDDGEETFHQRLEEDLKNLQNEQA